MNKENIGKKLESYRLLERKLSKLLAYDFSGIGIVILATIAAFIIQLVLNHFGVDKSGRILAAVYILVSLPAALLFLAIPFLFLAMGLLKTFALILNAVSGQWKAALRNIGELAATIFVFFLIFMFLTSIAPSRSKSRDARRQADMRQLVSAQEMYYGEFHQYFPAQAMPMAIGIYLTSVPVDPGGGVVISCDSSNPAFIYCALDNTGDPQKFCYYAKLENVKNQTYFTASHVGNFKRAMPPRTLEECAQGD